VSQPICDICHVEVAKFIIGDAETGEQAFICGGDIIGWSVAKLLEFVDTEAWPHIRAAVLEAGPPPPAEPEVVTPRPPRRRGSQAAEAQGQAPPPPAEGAPAAADGG